MTDRECKNIMGEGGECICHRCETRVPHKSRVPCQQERCPECGAKMLRVGGEHYLKWMARKSRQG